MPHSNSLGVLANSMNACLTLQQLRRHHDDDLEWMGSLLEIYAVNIENELRRRRAAPITTPDRLA